MAVTGGVDHDFTIKKAMREKWQPYSSRSPSFLRKEVPRRGGGWLPQRNGKGMGRGVSSFRYPVMQDLWYPQCLSFTI